MSIYEVLSLAEPALDGSSILPIMSHFCFTEGLFYAYNDRIAVVIEEDLGVGTCAIRGRTLLDILQRMPDAEFVDKGSAIELKKGSFSASLPKMEGDSFIFSMPELSETAFKVEGEFFDALSLITPLSNKASIHPEQAGVTVSWNKGVCNLYATEHTTTVAKKTIKSKGKGWVVLSQDTCNDLLKVYRASGASGGVLTVSKDWLVCELESDSFPPIHIFCHTLLVEKMASYETVIASAVKGAHPPVSFPEGLLQSLEIARSLHGTDQRPVARLSRVGKKWSMAVDGAYGNMKAVSIDLPDVSLDTVIIDPVRLLTVSEKVSKLALGENAVHFLSEDETFFYAVAHIPSH